MDLVLERYSYATTETEGWLSINEFNLTTIERPWLPSFSPGGRPFESCIPDGEYFLHPWTRPNGAPCWLIENPDNGVWPQAADRPKESGGRYLVLIHVGNWVTDVVGCIAPGCKRSLLKNPETNLYERAVSSSGEAMRILNDQLGSHVSHQLTIRPVVGAKDRI